MTKSKPPSLDRLVRLAKALADPGRLRILGALRDGELCVCQLTALLDLAPSTVSRHVTLLRDAGLLRDRREGRWVYVRRDASADPAAARLLAWVDEHLGEGAAIGSDDGRLREILALPVEQVAAAVHRGADDPRPVPAKRKALR